MQIHELNNFTGTLGSGAYLAIDDGNDTGKISSQGLLAATEARIDNIIAGPAPSAEEIVDARLGDDGVTYPSLGDAIRDQFSDVKSDLKSNNDIYNSILSVTDDEFSFSVPFEIGSINSLGELNPSTIRIRTKDFIFFKKFSSLTFDIETGYRYEIEKYYSDNTFSASGWQTTENTITQSDEPTLERIKIIIRREDNGNIYPTEASNLSIAGVSKLSNALAEAIAGVSEDIDSLEAILNDTTEVYQLLELNDETISGFTCEFSNNVLTLNGTIAENYTQKSIRLPAGTYKVDATKVSGTAGAAMVIGFYNPSTEVREGFVGINDTNTGTFTSNHEVYVKLQANTGTYSSYKVRVYLYDSSQEYTAIDCTTRGRVSSLETHSEDIDEDILDINNRLDAIIPADDVLNLKSIFAFGDSITYGANNSGVSYVDKVATNHSMVLTKKAVSGATFVKTLLTPPSTYRSCILEQIDSTLALTAPDYIVLSGGINDASASATLGTLDISSNNAYDLSGLLDDDYTSLTFTEAVELAIYKLKQAFPLSKLCGVITPRAAGADWNTSYAVRLEEIYNKWAVPIVNFQKVGNLLNYSALPYRSLIFTDNVHPNNTGYVIMSKYLDSMLKSI